MAKAAREHLTRALNSHAQNINETFQMLDQTVAYSLKKVEWTEVIKLGEEVSKQATVAGMLWTGTPKVSELEENLVAYFNKLQGFVLLCHGSSVGAGPTLHASIHASAKKVVDGSLALLKEAVCSYGSQNVDSKLSVPQLAGSVWEACEALKKIPTTNTIAIGRAITQVAVSMKDVLREMKELEPAPANHQTSNEAAAPQNDDDDDDSCEVELGTDLSPEEMTIAQSVTTVVSETLLVIKELIRFITGLLKQENSFSKSSESTDSLERLLEICKEIGIQIDELGACVYPPQEVPLMKATLEKILHGIDRLRGEVRISGGSAECFFQACEGFDTSARTLESELSKLDNDLLGEMRSLDLGS